MGRPGYIALFRQIQDHWTWKEKPYSVGQAWVDILLSACFHESKLRTGDTFKIVPRGSWHTSIATLQERWGWGERKVRSFLRALCEDEMVTIESSNRGTTITIVNYGKYQVSGRTDAGADVGDNAGANAVPDAGADAVHSNNTKKGNKGKKKTKASAPEFDFSPEELERHDQKDEAYWREALRREREGTLYD